MAETPTAVKTPEAPPKVTKKFHIQADDQQGLDMLFEQKEVSRGDFKGQKYWTPSEVKLADMLLAWGEENVLDTFVTQRMNQLFIGLSREVTDDDGTFDEEKFIKLASELSRRGDKIPDMIAQQAALAEEFCQYDVTNPSHIPILQRIGKQMKKLQEGIKNKRRKSKEDEAAETDAAKVAA